VGSRQEPAPYARVWTVPLTTSRNKTLEGEISRQEVATNE
jgi:hypothetical protein